MSRILQGSLKFLLTNALRKSIDKPFQLEYICFTQHLCTCHWEAQPTPPRAYMGH